MVEIASAITADCRGVRNFPWQLPLMTAECSDLPSNLPWQFAVVCFGNYRGNGRRNCRVNRRGMPWFTMEFAVDCRPSKLPWQLPWSAEIVVAIAADDRGMPRFSAEIAVD